MAAAGAFAAVGCAARFAFAAVPDDRRLVVVILRGALDGLAAVPPHGDKDYAGVRGALALQTSGTGALHDLDGFFGLHPALTNLKGLYDAKELIVFHNICSPYRDRSHFDGQNVLEAGGTSAASAAGWLAQPRAGADGHGDRRPRAGHRADAAVDADRARRRPQAGCRR